MTRPAYADVVPLDLGWMFDFCRLLAPRKVSQNERRRKERRLRSNGIRGRKGAK